MYYYWLNVCWMTQNPLISIIPETIYSACNAHGNWKIANGEWQMVNGERQTANGKWQMTKIECDCNAFNFNSV